MMPEYYKVTLEDHGCPSCTSGSKGYFGTLPLAKRFMEKLAKTERYDYTVKAFEEFFGGDPNAINFAGYNEHRLMEPVELLRYDTVYVLGYEWEFLNAHGWPYWMHFEKAEVERIFVKQPDGKLCRAIRPKIWNLEYTTNEPTDRERKWDKLSNNFWGFPAMLTLRKRKGESILTANLFLPEQVSDDEKKLLESFEDNAVNLDCICWDIFGDG